MWHPLFSLKKYRGENTHGGDNSGVQVGRETRIERKRRGMTELLA
jgi:hypothetical protein